jgi:glycosyltransferase involved in cell wall biosynthesis
MRRVLFLAYYFPPLGGGGVQRSLAFTRYLPEHGFAPTVVTGPADGLIQWGPRDGTLVGRVHDDVEVIRVEGPEPGRTAGLRCRAERWLRVEEPFSRWWVDGVVAASGEAARSADVIYASMSPFETGRAAARLAEATGKPWVADLRDPWALDDWLVFPSALHRRLELWTMRRTLSTAAAIVMNTPEAAEQLLRHAPELGDRPVLTITNGFDPADLDGAAPPRDPQIFRIVHAGHVHTAPQKRSALLGRRALGGSARGLDVRTRSHLYLVEAVSLLLERRPDLRGRVQIELVGPLSAADAGALPEFAIGCGYLPHTETMELQRAADLLFMPMHDLAPGLRARIVPGKTYEYLASGTPILGAVPDGDAGELLEAAGNAIVCSPSDAAGMSRAIEDQVDRKLRGEPPAAPDPLVLRRYDRRTLTRQLAGVFEQIAPAGEREPALPEPVSA